MRIFLNSDYSINRVDENDNTTKLSEYVVKSNDEAIALKKQKELSDIQKAFNNAIQTHLDTKAKNFRYENIMSARSYAGYKNPFQTEAQKLAIWASNCWVKAGQIEVDVKANIRKIPTVDEFLLELPIFDDVLL